MPRYVDWSDVVRRYRKVAAEHAEADANLAFVEPAEDEVDARLASRYAVPFIPGSLNAPGLVRDLAIDLAYYKMIWQTEAGDKLIKQLNERFDKISKGEILLTTSVGIVDMASATAWTDKNYRTSFGPDDPLNWSVSSAWQGDAASERFYD